MTRFACQPSWPWTGDAAVFFTPRFGSVFVFSAALAASAGVTPPDAVSRFRHDIQPILTEYCYDCHGDGMKKGGVAFDELKTPDTLLNHELWWKVLKNVRAGIMPPAKKPRPSAEQQQLLARWIKYDAFGIDPQHPDPGRVTIRRLNRVEYRNTIRDLMGIEFKADEEFPPDDTGYGFDDIGDVLTVSPLLLEKYMQAAESIVASAVPTVAKVVREQRIPGGDFRSADGKRNGDRLTFYEPAGVASAFSARQPGTYQLALELNVAGAFDFDPGRCALAFKIDAREVWRREFAWEDNKKFRFQFQQNWQPGEHRLAFELQPLTPADQKRTSVDMRITAVRVLGPLEPRFWAHTENYERFFPRDTPPAGKSARRAYAAQVLRAFATKAFRRPVDDRTLKRLVAIAEAGYEQPRKHFEEGVAQAMVAVLASPHFLFRVESTDAGPRAGPAPLLDEYALASRLSYFLWSTMPDQELFQLAARGELRQNLGRQVQRLLADPRSEALIDNFTGQWLQVRDVPGIAINERVVLARDRGEEKELERAREEFRRRLASNAAGEARKTNNTERAAFRRRLFAPPAVELNDALRRAMRQETEMAFGYVVRQDRSVLELIDSDYTFLNGRLARLYGVPDVTGDEMRRVTLPADSPRGGVLTEGTVLVVTSNPTRTSAVKRGLFILDNILGLPTPPPPPDVPLLEDSEKAFQDHEPTLRETLELHRSKPLCSSCHSRMDPLGLALENFNALGMWRDQERGRPIDAGGKLVTGEAFHGIRELKRILIERHRLDFYRCLTEKLLTYALGRGLDYYDVETVDRIVDRLDRAQGRFSALLQGILESAPFQERRNATALTAAGRSQEQLVQSSKIADNAAKP